VRYLLTAALGFLLGVSAVMYPFKDTRMAASGQAARVTLAAPAPEARADTSATVVPLEEARGVWIVPVTLNGVHEARFLLDTGSSVTLVSPRLAARLPGGLPARDAVELQTLTGLTTGPAGRLASLRIGDADLRDVPVVLHDPGPGIDGILGNTVLARYRLTVDSRAKLLHLAAR